MYFRVTEVALQGSRVPQRGTSNPDSDRLVTLIK
jgi:hypothetical protein